MAPYYGLQTLCSLLMGMNVNACSPFNADVLKGVFEPCDYGIDPECPR